MRSFLQAQALLVWGLRVARAQFRRESERFDFKGEDTGPIPRPYPCDRQPRRPCYLFALDELLQRRDGVRHLNMLDLMDARGSLTEGRDGQAVEWGATGQEGARDENKVS